MIQKKKKKKKQYKVLNNTCDKACIEILIQDLYNTDKTRPRKKKKQLHAKMWAVFLVFVLC